jgi:hypothetical protein
MAGNLAAQSVTYNYTGGLQYFTVPSGVTQVTIDAYGAQGGDSYWYGGGYGARIVGTVSVSGGQQLKIMVGGKGGTGYCGGGGGGTFVTTTANAPLVIAGGGGGAGYYGYPSGYASGTTSTTGNPGWCGACGATAAGGGAGPNGGGAIYYYYGVGAGGGGLTGNGAGGGYNCGGTSFANGGTGGCGVGYGGAGGYGGGGGGDWYYWTGGGGGGGYGGGGGGEYYGQGGGGGSYNGGSGQTNQAGVRAGNGVVTISYATPPPCAWTGVNNSWSHYGETRIVPPCDGSYGTLASGSGTYQYFTLYNGSQYEFITDGGSPFTPNLTIYDANPAWSARAWAVNGNITYNSTYSGDHILITNRNSCQQHDFTGQSALIRYREVVNPGTVTGNTNEICQGGSITFTRSGGTGIPRYWIAKDGNYWSDCADCYDGQNSFTRTFSTPGTYLIRTHSRGAGSGCWNWNQASDFTFYVRAPVTNGQLLLNGSASNITVGVGEAFTIAQGGGNFQGGNYWYWIGSDDDNVPGGWVGGSGWNYMSQGNANTGSFTYSFSTPGVYVIHTNASNVCGWGGGVTRFVTVKAPLLPLTGTQDLACGSTTTFKSDRLQMFTSVGNSTFNVPSGLNGNIEVLVVGGGGGGGMDMGGGGGGGGVVHTTYQVTSGQAIPVTVGAGGAGAPAACTGGQPCGHQYTIPAYPGGNSVFGNITAYGGGAGGSSYNGYSPGPSGGNGGSGGGASGYSDGGFRAGGTAVAGQGNRGGNQGGQYYSGGGGGAGGPGGDGPGQANGGPGYACAITGTNYYWGGGGGGAGYSIGGGNGGIGGGGGGAAGSTSGGAGINNGGAGGGGCTGCWTNTPGGNGGANTGGGGGGGGHYNANNNGGSGGSGIVVVRYPSTGGTWSSSNTAVATVNTSGVITAVSPGTATITYSITEYGSTSTVTRNVVVSGPPVPTLSGNQNITCGATTTFTPDLPTGGNSVTSTGGYRVHQFTGVGTQNFTVPSGFSGSVEVMVVGGGGGGGSDMGGGGGGGGFIYTPYTVAPGNISVTVGAGGTGAPAGQGQVRGSNGGNSVFGALTAFGGGGGASNHDQSINPAGNGGSGGGCSGGNGGAQPGGSGYGGGARGTGVVGQGNSGSWGGGYWYPGGGGGAGGAGSTNPAHGGIGIQCAITGTNYYWAGGGGGAGYSAQAGNGGAGGGGGGSGGGGANATGGSGINPGANGTAACAGCWAQVPGGNGGANTGGGGGGGSHYNASNNGGNGGSGIVVVRYREGTWSSSNTAVATVNASGVVTGVSAGTATITYTVGSGACVATSSRTVTVGAPAAPQAVGNITLGPIPSVNGSTIIPDANITASTCYPGNAGSCNTSGGDGHESWRGRLFNSSAGVQAWASTSPFTGCWWQADLGSVRPVNGISSQIRGDCCPDQRMGSYTVKTSIDGVTWFDVPGTFAANPTNGDYSVVTNWFGQYNARYVRVYPITWGGHLSTRIEVHSIPEGNSGSPQTVYASAEISSGSNTVRWWDAPSGGNLLATGQWASFSISSNTTVYAEGYNSGTGCASSTRTPVLLRINDIYGAGPGGVGNTNGKSEMSMWLNASAVNQGVGSAVSTWSDASGVGNNATQATASAQPTLQTQAVLNNQPVLRFDGGDILNTGNFINNTQRGYYAANAPNPYTCIAVAKYNGTNSRVISSTTHNWLMGQWGNNTDAVYAEGWITNNTGNGACSGCCGNGTDNNGHLYSLDGNRVYSRFYKENNLLHHNSCGIYSAGGYSFGGWGVNGSELSAADVAEVINYNLPLNEARRNIVANYLAGKYSLAITNDIYAGNDVGDCDFDIAGIGREASGIHEQTQSGGLYLSNSSFPGYLQNNGDYLMIGRTSSGTSWETSDLATCASPNITRRLSRIWYISKSDVGNNGGNVTLRFNFTDLGLGTPVAGTYRLISRAANSGNFSNVATGTINGNGIDFTINASSLTNGQYTLGYEADIPRSVAFNGSAGNYITVPTSATMQTTGDFTYEMWVRPTSFTSNNTYFENGTWSGQTTLLRQDGPGNINLYISGSSLGSIAYAPPLNQWTHLALVRSGSTITLYANGTSVGTFTAYGAAITPTTPMYIGASTHSGGSQNFNGQIDEFRLWNVARSVTDITNNRHTALNNASNQWGNLQAYYKFNETSGKILDLSRNSNNGDVAGTVTKTDLHPATPSISGTATVCQNSTNTYTLATTNANSRLTYNWSVAGGTINSGQGTSSISVTWTTAGSQSVNCTVTHSNECQTETATLPVTVQSPSNAGTVVQTPASGSTVCAGTNVNYTTTGTNGTFNYFEYQWNTTAGSYSGSWLTTNPANWTASVNGASILYVRAVYTNGVCPAAVSAPVNVTVNAPSVAGTVTQTPPSGSSVCDGANVNYSYSGGTGTFNYFEYQWNTTAGSYSGSWMATNPANWTAGLNGASVLYVRAVVTNGVCPSVATAPVNVTVNPNLPVSVSIAASPSGSICTGTSVTFTATPTNGGTTPVYQWRKNGNPVGTNSTTYTDAGLAGGDVITCVLTSNATCPTGNPATSNAITMTVNPTLPVSVSIAASPSGAVCAGTNVTFTATPVNGGSTPVYQWRKNGNPVGTNSTTYSDAGLAAGDVITCVLTSNAVCGSGSPATSNSITMSVSTQTVGGSVVSAQTICYNTPMADIGLVGSNGNVVKWQKSNDNFVSNIVDITNTSTLLTGASQGNLTQDTWFRAVVQSGVCPQQNSSSVKITVAPAASGGTLASAQTICAGQQMADLSVSGYVGGIVKWQKSNDNFSSNIVDIANTNPTLTGASQGALTQDTWYRVVVQSGGGCPEALSTVVKITVNPAPNVSNFSVTSGPVCSGGVATVTVNSTTLGNGTFTVGYNLTGANAASGLTASVTIAGNSGTFSTPVLAAVGTTTVTVTSVTNASSCTATVSSGNTANITISAGPTVSISGAGEVCVGGSVTLTANPSGGSGSPLSYQWERSANGGGSWSTVQNTASATYATSTSLGVGNYLYKVTYTQSGANCSAVSGNVSADVKADPLITLDPVDAYVCVGGTEVMTVNATGGSPTLLYEWEDDNAVILTDGDPTGVDYSGVTTSTLTISAGNNTPVIVKPIWVKVYAANPGCDAAYSLFANYTVVADPVVTNPTPASQTGLCAGGSASPISVSVSGGIGTVSYQWYSNSVNATSGGTLINGATSASYTPQVTGATTYYYCVVTQTGPGCGPVTTSATAMVAGGSSVSATVVVDECMNFAFGDKYYVMVTGTGGVPPYTYPGSFYTSTSNQGLYEVNAGSSTPFVVTDANGCSHTTAPVTAPTGRPTDITYASSSGNMTVDCWVNSYNKWVTFRDPVNNNAIMAINDNQNNLGLVTVDVYKDATPPVIYNNPLATNCTWTQFTAMRRHFKLSSTVAPTSGVDVMLFFTEQEYADLKADAWNNNTGYPNPDYACTELDDVYNFNQLYVTKYSGPNEDGNYLNNQPSGLYRVFGDNTTPNRPLTKGQYTSTGTGFQQLYGGNTTHHYVQMTVTEFSEFWIHGSQQSTPLPVQMIYLQADAIDNSFIRLSWATAVEINNDGFDVERSVDGQNWVKIGFVDGHDNSTVQNNYRFDDVEVSPDVVYYYRLRQVDNDGAFEYTDIVSARIRGAVTFNVAEFVPNPTMDRTDLVISGTKDQEVSVTFYDVVGRKVLESVHGIGKGANRISFDLGRLPSGTYTAVVTSANEVYTRKVVLAR